MARRDLRSFNQGKVSTVGIERTGDNRAFFRRAGASDNSLIEVKIPSTGTVEPCCATLCPISSATNAVDHRVSQVGRGSPMAARRGAEEAKWHLRGPWRDPGVGDLARRGMDRRGVGRRSFGKGKRERASNARGAKGAFHL